MSVWKIGWCVGDEINKFADDMRLISAEVWHTNDVVEIENHLECIFRFLGHEDSDIVYLYFLSKKRQVDICTLLDKTQPAVSYDIKRVKNHVDFVIFLLSVVDEFVDFIENAEHGLTQEQLNILVLLFFSTSFTKTSKVLVCHQITCRNRFDKTLEELHEKGFDNIVEIFETILKNLNMVKKNIYKNK